MLLSLMMISGNISAAENPASVKDGVLGLLWGDPLPAIQAKYADAKIIPQVPKVGVVDRDGILGVRSKMGDIFVLTLDGKGGLTSVSFQASPADTAKMLLALDRALGKSRVLEQRSPFNTFTHVYEWNTPAVSARVNYSTKESGEGAAPLREISVEVHRGPLGESLIDTMSSPVRQQNAGRVP